jgi:hypothetical protein
MTLSVGQKLSIGPTRVQVCIRPLSVPRQKRDLKDAPGLVPTARANASLSQTWTGHFASLAVVMKLVIERAHPSDEILCSTANLRREYA